MSSEMDPQDILESQCLKGPEEQRSNPFIVLNEEIRALKGCLAQGD